jgi:hypothetical protein
MCSWQALVYYGGAFSGGMGGFVAFGPAEWDVGTVAQAGASAKVHVHLCILLNDGCVAPRLWLDARLNSNEMYSRFHSKHIIFAATF